MTQSSSTPVSAEQSALKRFLASEAAGGVLLMIAAAAAVLVANSPLASAYQHLLHMPIGPTLSDKLGPMTLHLWINDGLMAIFFLLVGLEIKRELVDGRLSSWEQRRLPALPALMGMAVPALIYLTLTQGDPVLSNGWAIPAATDIAFAIGALALLGRHAPLSLKLMLVSVAIIDDMGAVAIIAVFYTSSINLAALVAAAAIIGGLYVMNRMRVMTLWPYLIGLALLWYVTLLSGVHATIAGVVGAFLIPYIPTPGQPDAANSPLHRLEHGIAPWVGFLIVPAFGFANAGVSFAGISLAEIVAPLPLGIAAGLFLGKQLGVFGGVLLAVKSGLATKPRGCTWLQIYAISMLCGIGFTMSLFISGLAFPGHPELFEESKIGIMLGSLLSALVACLILRFAPKAHDQVQEEAGQEAEILQDGDVKRI
ncbi:Na+/H+ antiporter NhaA [Pseudomonas aeruginosa]|jgi:NhaA family Na+:H+ antiporter|uniref:Na+/H+ antiporter NhaA n=2 Tax=Pseudomonas aeruginosa TaxID=287 RepID=UPI00053EF626|nr:Na+/H+ antiporter NhaA [Pseudomonas aeruginosa]KSM41363.1 Na+/H+ antiporter NhaA [Pseudomonas aeruginosa]MCT5270157.1 Na+/H+ antiporter NhaA [Pseudomonas aeruginosa]MDA3221137.1 Na+/H+ antiporter NhaA [Pseudomonas aeruginosa]MDE5050534.1 Na+/H+ antiporter NhaA [Pseudomonas aeruginosa]MDV6915873.1 Na+/H+ antiporter NhaA [Pseudomonas aeruginosa]